MLSYIDALAHEYRWTLRFIFELPFTGGFELINAINCRRGGDSGESYIDRASAAARRRMKAWLHAHFEIT